MHLSCRQCSLHFTEKADSTHIRIVSLASDGEARRARVLIDLCYRSHLAPSSPICDVLAGLELLDLYVGDDDISADKDGKHVFKRCRNPFLSQLIHGVRVTNSKLCVHLDAGHSVEHIHFVLNPADKHHVLLAFRLIYLLLTLRRIVRRVSE